MLNLRKLRLPDLVIVALIVLYNLGPHWIASYYMSQTTPSAIQYYKEIYWKRVETNVSDQQREEARLWCKIRRIELDDGHIETSTFEDWQMVFSYFERNERSPLETPRQ